MKVNIEKAIESFRINFSLIKRDGAEDLLKWIETETDFYTAPASAAYHLACGSGLLIHSLNVRNNLDMFNHRLNLGFKDETRGTLFFEIEDILRKHQPKAIFLENVQEYSMIETVDFDCLNNIAA